MQPPPYGIANGWPGTYWLKRTMPAWSHMTFKDGTEMTAKEKQQMWIDACERQCNEAYALQQEDRPIDGLSSFLSKVHGETRAVRYWMKEAKLN